MATAEVDLNFITQIKESRKKIGDCFNKSHEALQFRETETGSSIEFEWNNQFETDIEQLGSIKLNSQTNIPFTRTFPPQVKPVTHNYKAKQKPIAYCCKNSAHQKAQGELNFPRGIAVLNQTGDIYIADHCNDCVQVFSCNGDYLFMFSEKMNKPIGICITQNKVFVAQLFGHCINMYELEGKLIKSAGSKGDGKVQFYYPHGVDVSDRIAMCMYVILGINEFKS
ncbi:NHL repeat containing protein [Oopsacas minuta]|uniref:NHL repeat containing protein n=1 Tax=Oopsacas minuta TaxID=111878 RepID=A0AAV7JN43_9METZ|nr:NHL repeat containing protein [Oopsacas minuta]